MKNPTSYRNLWHKWTAPRAADVDQARREYMIKATCLIMSVVSVGLTAIYLVGWLAQALPFDSLLIAFGMVLLSGSGWWLAHRGHWRTAGHIPTAVIFVTGAYGNWVGGMGAPAIALYALAIVLAAVLQGERALWATMALSIAAIVGISWMQRAGYVPVLRSVETAFWNRVFILIGTYATIAAMVWFLVTQFKKALSESRTYAQDLAQRTAELTESTRQLEQEIVERRHVQETFRQGQELFIHGPVVLLRWGAQEGWPVEYASSNVLQFGYSAEDLVSGRIRYDDMIHPEDRRRVIPPDTERAMCEHQESGLTHSEQDYRIVCADGQVRWVHDYTRLIRDDRGRLTCYDGYIFDITDRKQAEEALRERAGRLELIARVGQRTTALLHVDDLLHQAVNLIGNTFHYYNTVILLVDGSEIVARAASLPEMQPLEGRVRLRIGQEGITGWVAASGEPLNVPDVSQEVRYHAVVEAVQTRSELAVPITFRNKVVGVLDVQSTETNAFSQIDVFTLQAIADQLAIAIENARLYGETHRRAERLVMVNRIGRAAGATLNLDDLMDQVYHEIDAIFAPDAFFIALYDPQDNQLDFCISIDQGIRSPPERRPLGTGLTSVVVGQKTSLLIGDFAKERETLPAAELWGTMKAPASWLGVPMLIGERVIGVICVQAYAPNTYSQEEQLLLSTIADQVAVAVEGARLYEAVQQELVERKRLEEQLVQAQKMEAIGRLAGGIAHDFNNLLTAIMGYTDLLIGDFSDKETAIQDLRQIQNAAEQAAALTGQLLAFGRKQILQPRVLDLNEIIRDLEGLLRRTLGEHVELEVILDPGLGYVEADPVQVQQVIVNLAVNARDAMPSGGRLTIETANVEIDADRATQHLDIVPGPLVMMSVHDTGVGIARELQERIFEPFFTTKEQGKGTGLGLATVHGVVMQSGGHIHVNSEPGRGTTFQVYLPRVARTDVPSTAAPAPAGLPSGTETVLLVEDEDAVRRLAQRVLRGSGYTVLEAAHATEAIQISGRHVGPIHLMITDVVMPGGTSGPKLAEHLSALRPQMRILYVSGYTDDEIVRHGVLKEGVSFLQKPFSPSVLTHKVRKVLDAPRQEETR